MLTTLSKVKLKYNVNTMLNATYECLLGKSSFLKRIILLHREKFKLQQELRIEQHEKVF